MKRLTIIGLWPDDVVKYCTEKCDCRRYAFDRILYHRGGRDARERICIPVVDRSGAVTTYLDLPVLFLEANAVYLHLDDGSDIFLSNTQMLLIANEVERLRAEAAGTGLKTLEKWFESGLPTAEDYLEPGDEVDADLIDYFLNVLPPRTNRAGLLQVGGEISIAIPPWKWVLKRLCAIYERDATMASLFDGIGGFPYIWEQLNGKGSCLWASEIELFPIAVTKYHFGEE